MWSFVHDLLPSYYQLENLFLTSVKSWRHLPQPYTYPIMSVTVKWRFVSIFLPIERPERKFYGTKSVLNPPVTPPPPPPKKKNVSSIVNKLLVIGSGSWKHYWMNNVSYVKRKSIFIWKYKFYCIFFFLFRSPHSSLLLNHDHTWWSSVSLSCLRFNCKKVDEIEQCQYTTS